MGRGNLVPKGNLEDYKYFYVSYELIHGEEYYNRDSYSIMQMEYEDWRENLWQKIKDRWDSFYRVDEFRDKNTYVLCKNRLNNIEFEDGETYLMIAVTIPYNIMDSIKNLAYKHMLEYYDGLLEIFMELYDEDFLSGKLTYRTGPWTSAPINLERVK